MSVAGSIASKRRLTKIDIDDKEKELEKIFEDFKIAAQFNEETTLDSPDSVAKIGNTYLESVPKLLQTIWGLIRTNFAKNDNEKVKEYETTLIDFLDNFGEKIRKSRIIAAQFLQSAYLTEKSNPEPLVQGTLWVLLNIANEQKIEFFQIFKNYFSLANQIKLFQFRDKLEDSITNFIIKTNHVEIKFVNTYFEAVSTYLSKLDQQIEPSKKAKRIEKDRYEMIEILSDYFFAPETNCFFTLLAKFLENYPLKYPCKQQLEDISAETIEDEEERKKKKEHLSKKIEQYSNVREEIFQQSYQMIQKQYDTLNIWFNKCFPGEEEEHNENNQEEEDYDEGDNDSLKEKNDSLKEKKRKEIINQENEAVHQFQEDKIRLFFDAILSELNYLIELSSQAQEDDHVTQCCNLCLDLFESLSNDDFNLPYSTFADFYNLAVENGQEETALYVQGRMIDTIDEDIDQLKNSIEEEKRLLSNEEKWDDSDDFKQQVSENRRGIDNKSQDLIPALIKASSTYFEAHPMSSNDENKQINDFNEEETQSESEEDIDEQPEEEDEGQNNPFSDLLDTYIDYSRDHITYLNTLLKPISSLRSNAGSVTSPKSKAGSPSKASISMYAPSQKNDALSKSSKKTLNDSKSLTMTQRFQLEKEQQEFMKLRDSLIQEAIAQTSYSLINILRAKMAESVRSDNIKETKSLSKEITKLQTNYGKMLQEIRKTAAVNLDVQKVKEIDTLIEQQSQGDNRNELLSSFEEALRHSIKQSIDKYHEKYEKYEEEQEREISEQYDFLEEQFQIMKDQVHVKEMTLLEKKLFIEKQKEEIRKFPEVEEMKVECTNLAQQRNFKAAEIKKKQLEQLQIKLNQEREKSILKEQNKKRNELLSKQEESLKHLEKETDKRIEKIKQEKTEEFESLKRNLSATIRRTLTKYANNASSLLWANPKETDNDVMGTSPREDGRKQDIQKKDEFSRKEIVKKFEKISYDELSEHGLDFVLLSQK